MSSTVSATRAGYDETGSATRAECFDPFVQRVDPASRVPLALLQIVVDGVAVGEINTDDTKAVPRTIHADFAILRAAAAPNVPDAVVSRALLAWSQLFGSISLELFGHLHNVIHDFDAYFTLQMRRAGEFLATGT